MISLIHDVAHYRQEGDLASFLHPDDRIFSSDRGVFITHGCVASVPAFDIISLLSEIDAHGCTQPPFLVFGYDFAASHAPEYFDLPSHMIHIDDHQWVTHYRIALSDDDLPGREHEALSYPHHVELMSPESKDRFIDKVNIALKHIDAGDISKIVISRQVNMTADVPIDRRLLVHELIASQPESFVYDVNGCVGASPELLVEKHERSLRCLPMAGTRRRHARIDHDDADIADLKTSSKDAHEHKYVVDDIVSRLGKVADNVTSSDSPHVVRLPHVSHLATSISATARENTTLLNYIDALHPTPAVAGTPTQAARDLIAEIEGFDRGTYAAPVGWIDARGDGQSAIALRCAIIEGTRARLFAGVGIVAGSDPEKEWDETQAKCGVMRDALMNITQ